VKSVRRHVSETTDIENVSLIHNHVVCERLIQAVSANETHAYRHHELVGNLFKIQPATMLDALFAGSTSDKRIGQKIIEDVVDVDRTNFLDAVPQEDILAWCEGNRAERYPMMAWVITLFRQGGAKTPLEWSSTASASGRAPDRLAVVTQYVRRFRPRSWSGSLAAAMEAPLMPLRALEAHPDSAVAEFAKTEGVRLRQQVEAVRRRETEEDKEADERFEC
jgi:hypothetical protein